MPLEKLALIRGRQSSGGLVAVDFVGIEGTLLHEVKGGRIAGSYSAIEAGAPARVAGSRALLANVEYEGVLVAVGPDLKDLLRVSGGGSLVP